AWKWSAEGSGGAKTNVWSKWVGRCEHQSVTVLGIVTGCVTNDGAGGTEYPHPRAWNDWYSSLAHWAMRSSTPSKWSLTYWRVRSSSGVSSSPYRDLSRMSRMRVTMYARSWSPAYLPTRPS